MLKKVFYNTAAQTIGKVITASSTLLVTIVIGRSLGPQGYGDFTKIFVFVGYFYTFSDFGLNAFYVKAQNAPNSLFKYLVGLRLVIGTLFALTASLIAFALPYNPLLGTGFGPQVKLGILIASLTILTQSLYTTANAYFQKNLRYDLSTIAAVFSTITVLALTFIASLTQPSLFAYTTAYVIGGFVLIALAYILIENRFKVSISPKFSVTAFKNYIVRSWPIGTALIFNLIYFRLDVIILSYTRTSQEVGIYGLAYQFFEAALSIPIFFANALFPLLANLNSTNQASFQKEVKRWILLLITCSLFLTIALIASSYLIPILFDNRFLPSQKPLIILSLGLPFFFVSALLWHLAIIKNRQKYLPYCYLLGAFFNLTLNLILIPKYGYLGASVTTGVSEAFITLLLIIAMRQKSNKTGKDTASNLK